MSKCRILVADPGQPVQKLLSLVFDSPHYDLDFALDGEEALGRALIDPPKLIIAELRLERLDGAALCQQLKEHPVTKSARVLFLTTCTSDWDIRRAQKAGCDDYMTKPFSPSILLRRVEALLANGDAVSVWGAARRVRSRDWR